MNTLTTFQQQPTPQSFELYLAGCRYEANKLPALLPDFVQCPYCPGENCRQQEEAFHRAVVPYATVWEGIAYSYLCEKCGQEWTTTESDAQALASLHTQPWRRADLLNIRDHHIYVEATGKEQEWHVLMDLSDDLDPIVVSKVFHRRWDAEKKADEIANQIKHLLIEPW